MLPRHDEPIAAIATAPGRGAVGIVRLSGRGLAALHGPLFGRPLRPRHAHYGPFLAADGSALDHGIALWFPAPHSYTGEDVLELQAHGGPVLLQLLLQRCLDAAAETDPATGRPRVPGLRLAQPGEFTERAFLNGKLDLAQAEAVADLIDASTEAAARSAARSLSGAFSQAVEALRDDLVQLRMLVEATLDFPEEDIDFLREADAAGQLARLQARLDDVLARTRQGALLREGMHVVIAGQPNAGKSSLLNALAQAEVAIVTPIAGTTRDVVQQSIQIHGVPLHVIDTAGLRDGDGVDEVERIGIARAWQRIESADAVLFVHDLSRAHDPHYASADAAIRAQLAARLAARVPVIDVWNKADAVGDASSDSEGSPDAGGHDRNGIRLSARTGAGLEALRQRLLQAVGWTGATPEGLFSARQRHVQALHRVRAHLTAAQAQLASPAPALELLAEELRLAHEALGTITGAFGADDLLGVIFSRFCIGK
ncbi:tRNA uridine-5-carboxymethylaminomethyl(34) synthesis GTPase MnmE [Tepidimonas taiwanensis]|uniref:tRNA modification GTPase MnmE n=1 Tax=Tepidimonas taiwanensis TaxID=307486 RepID=A0A554X328_9BURK|nr:tRNA uridine-5-carboxymethylaminomethyl(34) synthesis GTPase MnmE [Tepidimonas taiwanensis]TSE30193.1 tRNA modification GTPase MnmE [Tepidimonas taiwanensis]UBQ05557.1 tRNA uridine-5-carboxymethylaminomethyl(34) synthesis GTPase MnmE [Tepidimonas taiwanensis]